MTHILSLAMLDIVSYITSPYAVWMPIAVIAALAVIGVLGIAYAFSSVLGRTDFGTWTRVKIYEVLLSILLIFVFFFVITTFFSLNPLPAYKAVNLVVSGGFSGAAQNIPACGDINAFVDSGQVPSGEPTPNVYTLSTCDMKQFLQYSLDLNGFIYQASAIVGVSPYLFINTSKIPPFSTIAGRGVGTTDEFILLPVGLAQFLGDLLGIFYLFFLINQVQLILLAASLLIFTVFMGMGLIARIFIVTRTFGGAMIAFAIGIGILYPLLVSFTYGFLNVGIHNLTGFIGSPAQAFSILAGLVSIALGAVTGFATLSWISWLIQYSGLLGAGFTLIPLLNLLIIDVFITDFSKAVGEKMDFMSLLTRLV